MGWVDGLLGPVILAEHLPLEHDAGPGGAAGLREHLAGHLVVFRLGQIHPGLRRIFHQFGVVGDRPDHRGARPQFWRHQRIGIVIGGIGRRIILEQIFQRQHQRAIGMIDHVGDQLAGGGLGPDTGDELAARRAHHLDLDLRKTLVEFLDDHLFDLGEIRRVEHQLAFLLGRRDQFGRAEFLGPCRCCAQRDAEPRYSGDCGDLADDQSCADPPLFLVYPLRTTLPCAVPRESQLAPPMSTPSKTICTRLKAAVLPILPPS